MFRIIIVCDCCWYYKTLRAVHVCYSIAYIRLLSDFLFPRTPSTILLTNVKTIRRYLYFDKRTGTCYSNETYISVGFAKNTLRPYWISVPNESKPIRTIMFTDIRWAFENQLHAKYKQNVVRFIRRFVWKNEQQQK